MPARLHAVGHVEGVRDHVRRVADAVGLRAHTFEVVEQPLPPGVRATCKCVEGRAFSRVTVAPEFYDLDPDEQHEALVHEVLHPLFHPLMQHVLDLEGELARGHYLTLRRVFERDLESAVDMLATALAQRIPVE